MAIYSTTSRRALTVACLAFLVMAISCEATTVLTWDGNTATAGLQDGGGNWDTTATNRWWNGTFYQFWNNANGDVAVFGVTNGTGSTVNLGIGIMLGGLTFHPAGSGSYTIKQSNAGNWLNLVTPGVITVNASNAIISAVITGAVGFAKEGAGALTLESSSANYFNTYSGQATVNGGALILNKTDNGNSGNGGGAILGALLINTNTSVQFLKNNQIINTTAVTLAGGAMDLNGKTDTIGSLAGGGSVTLGSGTLTIGGNSSSTTFSGVISGVGNLVKIGSGTLTFGGTNLYAGLTTISNGTLALTGDGSISSSAVINLGAVGILDTTSRSDATLRLANGQTLKGNGVLGGSVIASNGSIIAPGTATIGTLTFNSSLVLNTGSSTVMKLNKTAGTNDVIVSLASITYGGTLSVTNLGGALTNGDSFKLFNAVSYNGTFASEILPPLPPGSFWDTSGLTNGSLKIGGTIVNQPRISNATMTVTDFIFSGVGGTSNGGFTVLSSTNLALTNWAILSTNLFDAFGNFIVTNPLLPSQPLQFYRLSVP